MVDFMTEAEAEAIARLSFRNRARVAIAARCGCFYCEAVFPSPEVGKWVDDEQTALCPRCGIDSVLADVTDAGVLRALHHYRFEVSARLTDAEWQEALTKGAWE
jgi:hypothetical protein